MYMASFQAPVPIENALQKGLIGASAFCLFIATLMVSLRLIAKIHSGKTFNASDGCILAALVRFSTRDQN